MSNNVIKIYFIGKSYDLFFIDIEAQTNYIYSKRIGFLIIR